MAILLVVMLTSLLQRSPVEGIKEADTALAPLPRQLGKHHRVSLVSILVRMIACVLVILV